MEQPARLCFILITLTSDSPGFHPGHTAPACPRTAGPSRPSRSERARPGLRQPAFPFTSKAPTVRGSPSRWRRAGAGPGALPRLPHSPGFLHLSSFLSTLPGLVTTLIHLQSHDFRRPLLLHEADGHSPLARRRRPGSRCPGLGWELLPPSARAGAAGRPRRRRPPLQRFPINLEDVNQAPRSTLGAPGCILTQLRLRRPLAPAHWRASAGTGA